MSKTVAFLAPAQVLLGLKFLYTSLALGFVRLALDFGGMQEEAENIPA